MKFQYCLQEIEKRAGLGESIKNLAMTEVPGTKPWFIRPGQSTSAVSGVRKAVRPGMGTATKAIQSGSGARTYDVSGLARQMGIK
jgi:hypothetical protein